MESRATPDYQPNPQHWEILRKGVRAWNEWRANNREVQPHLRGADLSEANLVEANLRGADLNDVVLDWANLGGADFSGADLTGADLSDTNLLEADFRGAILVRVNFVGVNLDSTYLDGADLSGATFLHTVIGFTDLTYCKGLDNIRHIGPSIIDPTTTKFDYKNLPIKFLEGCGWNKWQIESLKLNDPDLKPAQVVDILYRIEELRNSAPIQPYSIFISYSREDEAFIQRIEEQFREGDIRFWRDVHDATAGPLEEQISRAIHMNRTVLLVLSKNSVESDWVEFEVRRARELQKEIDRHVICPVALDDSWKSCKWPRRLRDQVEEYNILDFSEWEDETSFEGQYGKLRQGLNIYYRKDKPEN